MPAPGLTVQGRMSWGPMRLAAWVLGWAVTVIVWPPCGAGRADAEAGTALAAVISSPPPAAAMAMVAAASAFLKRDTDDLLLVVGCGPVDRCLRGAFRCVRLAIQRA